MNTEGEFVSLIQQNEGIIFKITNIYADTSEDKKDLYQEIVYQLWRGFQKFRSESKASTWMYRIALNTAINGQRKKSKTINTSSLDQETIHLVELNDELMNERVRLLREQIAKLNDLEKAIIILFLENKSHQEIAEITGLSTSNVGTRFGRIKEKLKTKMNKAS